MKMRHLHRTSCMALVTLALMFVATAAFAQGAMKKETAMDAPGSIATIWVIWPKAGQAAQFETAIKNYAAWRKNAGETFNWQIYQPVVGSDLGYYVIRSGQHTWKDMDTNNAWEVQSKANDEYEKQVGQFTDKAEHYFAESDSQHSHWIESPDYKYFGVTKFHTKPGTYRDRLEALGKIKKAADDEKWAYPYEISYTVGGRDALNVVTPMRSYAEMADPDPSLMKILSKSLGSEADAEATMKQFSSTIKDSDYTVYVFRPDLSTPR